MNGRSNRTKVKVNFYVQLTRVMMALLSCELGKICTYYDPNRLLITQYLCSVKSGLDKLVYNFVVWSVVAIMSRDLLSLCTYTQGNVIIENRDSYIL